MTTPKEIAENVQIMFQDKHGGLSNSGKSNLEKMITDYASTKCKSIIDLMTNLHDIGNGVAIDKTWFSENLLNMIAFVVDKHGDKERKYTCEPYSQHPIRVAKWVLKQQHYTKTPNSNDVYTALCHDLFEDTDCTENDLSYFMKHKLNCNAIFIQSVINNVKCLTNEYTSKKYPNFNRDVRKDMELKRLEKHPQVHNVKYADIIDNVPSICEYDKKFAKVYVKEKLNFLHVCDGGSEYLRDKAYEVIHASMIAFDIKID